MTLKEAIDTLQGWRDEIESGAIHVTSTIKPQALEAFRLVIEAASKQAEADAAAVTLTEAWECPGCESAEYKHRKDCSLS